MATEPLRVLEIAPGPYSEYMYGSRAFLEYVSIDLMGEAVSCRADLCHLPFARGSFDLVICYHVLEHVQDDRMALAQLRQVLAEDGEMFVQVPIEGEVTDEDASVTDPLERLARFGQSDHVRQYGVDFFDRVRDEGFSVELLDYARRMPRAETDRFGIDPTELVTLCRPH